LKAASFPDPRSTPGNQKYHLGDRPERGRQGISSSLSGAQLNERRELSAFPSDAGAQEKREGDGGSLHGSGTTEGLLTFSFLVAALVVVAPRAAAAAAVLRALPLIASNGVCIRPVPPQRTD
jgi:hypothetical protein